jgi:hypothetical protein
MNSPQKLGHVVGAILFAAALAYPPLLYSAEILPAETRPSAELLARNSPLPAQVQQVLQIPDRGSDVLPLIAEALKHMNDEDVPKARALNNLVDGLLAGPHPYVLIEQILPHMDVTEDSNSQQNIPGWQYGTLLDKIRLTSSLLKLAEAAQARSPKRASEIARAALMLAALDDYAAGSNTLLLVVQNPEKAKKLLALPEEQFALLRGISEKRNTQLNDAANEAHAAYRAMDAISATKEKPVTKAETEAILDHLDKAFRKLPRQYGYQQSMIADAWTYLNLMRALHNQEGQELTRKQLEQWAHDFPDPYLNRWIAEALTREEPPPGRMFVEYIMQPDGTMKAKDVDERK